MLVGSLTVKFNLERHGSLERCKTAARSFQVSFNSMRARDRRRKPGTPGSLGIDPKSDYDRIACMSRPIANSRGWEIYLTTEGGDADFEICDREGNPLVNDTIADNEVKALVKDAGQFAKDPERLRRLLRMRPALSEMLAGFGLKHPDRIESLDDLEGDAVKVPVPSEPWSDVADTPIDKMWD